MGDLAERFWPKVKICGPDDCWEWHGATDGKKGYGRIRAAPRHYLQAHRVAWELTNGPIPSADSYHGICVLHHCDNPPCCNPAHLYLGGPVENARDRQLRGRSNTQRGEACHQATLTEADILQIRERYAAGERQRVLAVEFDVRQPAIGRIIRGERWEHAPGPRTDGRFRRACGEENRQAKLTEATAREILQRYASGETQIALAAEFNVLQGTISKLVRRVTWRHLTA